MLKHADRDALPFLHGLNEEWIPLREAVKIPGFRLRSRYPAMIPPDAVILNTFEDIRNGSCGMIYAGLNGELEFEFRGLYRFFKNLDDRLEFMFGDIVAGDMLVSRSVALMHCQKPEAPRLVWQKARDTAFFKHCCYAQRDNRFEMLSIVTVTDAPPADEAYYDYAYLGPMSSFFDDQSALEKKHKDPISNIMARAK